MLTERSHDASIRWDLLGAIDRLSRYLSRDFLGGPRVLRLSWVINLQKGATLPFVALLMVLYRNGSMEAWAYLALHGSYGLCWILKHVAFPDARWDVRITFGGAFLSSVLVLGLYWVLPFLLILSLSNNGLTGSIMHLLSSAQI